MDTVADTLRKLQEERDTLRLALHDTVEDQKRISSMKRIAEDDAALKSSMLETRERELQATKAELAKTRASLFLMKGSTSDTAQPFPTQSGKINHEVISVSPPRPEFDESKWSRPTEVSKDVESSITFELRDENMRLCEGLQACGDEIVQMQKVVFQMQLQLKLEAAASRAADMKGFAFALLKVAATAENRVKRSALHNMFRFAVHDRARQREVQHQHTLSTSQAALRQQLLSKAARNVALLRLRFVGRTALAAWTHMCRTVRVLHATERAATARWTAKSMCTVLTAWKNVHMKHKAVHNMLNIFIGAQKREAFRTIVRHCHAALRSDADTYRVALQEESASLAACQAELVAAKRCMRHKLLQCYRLLHSFKRRSVVFGALKAAAASSIKLAKLLNTLHRMQLRTAFSVWRSRAYTNGLCDLRLHAINDCNRKLSATGVLNIVAGGVATRLQRKLAFKLWRSTTKLRASREQHARNWLDNMRKKATNVIFQKWKALMLLDRQRSRLLDAIGPGIGRLLQGRRLLQSIDDRPSGDSDCVRHGIHRCLQAWLRRSRLKRAARTLRGWITMRAKAHIWAQLKHIHTRHLMKAQERLSTNIESMQSAECRKRTLRDAFLQLRNHAAVRARLRSRLCSLATIHRTYHTGQALHHWHTQSIAQIPYSMIQAQRQRAHRIASKLLHLVDSRRQLRNAFCVWKLHTSQSIAMHRAITLICRKVYLRRAATAMHQWKLSTVRIKDVMAKMQLLANLSHKTDKAAMIRAFFQWRTSTILCHTIRRRLQHSVEVIVHKAEWSARREIFRVWRAAMQKRSDSRMFLRKWVSHSSSSKLKSAFLQWRTRALQLHGWAWKSACGAMESERDGLAAAHRAGEKRLSKTLRASLDVVSKLHRLRLLQRSFAAMSAAVNKSRSACALRNTSEVLAAIQLRSRIRQSVLRWRQVALQHKLQKAVRVANILRLELCGTHVQSTKLERAHLKSLERSALMLWSAQARNEASLQSLHQNHKNYIALFQQVGELRKAMVKVTDAQELFMVVREAFESVIPSSSCCLWMVDCDKRQIWTQIASSEDLDGVPIAGGTARSMVDSGVEMLASTIATKRDLTASISASVAPRYLSGSQTVHNQGSGNIPIRVYKLVSSFGASIVGEAADKSCAGQTHAVAGPPFRVNVPTGSALYDPAVDITVPRLLKSGYHANPLQLVTHCMVVYAETDLRQLADSVTAETLQRAENQGKRAITLSTRYPAAVLQLTTMQSDEEWAFFAPFIECAVEDITGTLMRLLGAQKARDKLKRAAKALKEARTEIAETRSQMSELQTLAGTLMRESASWKELHSTAEKALKECKNDVSDQNRELRSAASSLLVEREKTHTLKAQISVKDAEILSKEKQLDEQRGIASVLQQKLQDADAAAQVLRAAVDELSLDDTSHHAMYAAQEALTFHEVEISQLRRGLQDARRECTMLATALSAVTSSRDDHETAETSAS